MTLSSTQHSSASERRAAPAPTPTPTGRISGIEVVSYTALLALIGLLASGQFDAMVPWR
jgi:hypothetical protein